jgi:hypothetical protein
MELTDGELQGHLAVGSHDLIAFVDVDADDVLLHLLGSCDRRQTTGIRRPQT